MGMVIDLEKEFVEAKAGDRIIGFAGLRSDRTGADGLAIIAQSPPDAERPYLTLTFLVDADPDDAQALAAAFGRVREEPFRAALGPRLRSILVNEIPRRRYSTWYATEITFYLAGPRGHERELAEAALLPVAARQAGFNAEALEWLPEEVSSRMSFRKILGLLGRG